MKFAALFLLAVIIAVATVAANIAGAKSSLPFINMIDQQHDNAKKEASTAMDPVRVFKSEFKKTGPGYFCIKIPYLFSTFKGTLIALAEARYKSCSDFAGTDLVMKRSEDFGKTWSNMTLLYGNTSLEKNITTVIGNAAPLQLRKTGRIVIPFCRNNIEVYQMVSDDDGMTFKGPFLIPNAVRPSWKWIGTGPPGAIQLQQSGRLVVPSYHGIKWPHWTDGTDTRSHLMLNDDDEYAAPDKWRVGGIAQGWTWSNECQAVELAPNHIVVAARSELTRRLQIESLDGGETLGFPKYIDITQPLGGCEGSIVFHRKSSRIFFSQTTNTNPARYNLTLWSSKVTFTDNGTKSAMGPWEYVKELSPKHNRTAYSSLQVMHPDQNRIGLLWEWSTDPAFIFTPTDMSFEVVWP